MRVHYPKLRNSQYYLPLNIFIASEGSILYLLFVMFVLVFDQMTILYVVFIFLLK